MPDKKKFKMGPQPVRLTADERSWLAGLVSEEYRRQKKLDDRPGPRAEYLDGLKRLIRRLGLAEPDPELPGAGE